MRSRPYKSNGYVKKRNIKYGLIVLMKAIGMSMYRAMFCLAEIKAYKLQDKMVEWVVSCRGKDDTITPQQVDLIIAPCGYKLACCIKINLVCGLIDAFGGEKFAFEVKKY